jgi:hypothetical protein
MALFRTYTAALLLAGLTLTAAPAFAQQNGRSGHEPKREAAARVPTRDRGAVAAGHVQSQPQTGLTQRALAQSRVEPSARASAQQSVQPRARVEAPAGNGVSNNRTAVSRYDNHVSDARRYDDHRYDNHHYDNRHYDNHTVIVRPYPYPTRTYVVPYGYRPYGYRPGWNLNLYFGAPYATYGYPAAYGYYALQPGVAYGALRIVDAPQDAQVLVDGYYAGVVDDYDGVFQHLNLVAGPHNIEIDEAGYEPILFAVNVQPGRTITYHADVY